MNEDFDKFEGEFYRYFYSWLWKAVALVGFLMGAGLVFIAYN